MTMGAANTLRNASILAVLGFAVTLVSLPLVTAGAAVATGSAAVHDWCSYGTMPDLRTTARRFGRALLPGLLATVVAALFAVLIVLDVRALIAGRVPGGPGLLAITVAVSVVLLGVAGLTVVQVGRQGGRGWLPAARLAVRCGLSQPGPVLGMGLTLVVAGLLAAFIPATTPILVGFALFAQHAIARRTLMIDPSVQHSAGPAGADRPSVEQLS